VAVFSIATALLRSTSHTGHSMPHHADIIRHLIREYQAFNGIEIGYRDDPPTALEFSRIVYSNRPVILRSIIPPLPPRANLKMPYRIGPRCRNGKIPIISDAS
jgi:hypothetical protein